MDIVQLALTSAATPSAGSIALAAAAGLSTSLGPCVAPRYLAVTAAVRNATPGERASLLGAFAAGTCLSYVALASLGSFVSYVSHSSRILYALLAIALIIAGIYALARGSMHSCRPRVTRSFGGIFLLGASSVMIVSPCCTPVVIGLGAMSGSMSLLAFVGIVVAFAIGHAAPLACVLVGAGALRGWTERYAAAAATVNAALLLALGAYYGLLA